MDKRGSLFLWISIILVVALVAAIFFYFVMFNPNNEKVYAGQEIKNPAANLTTEEAIMAFDEDFVFYLLYSIKAYNLHNPPLSSNMPKMEIHAGDDVFNAVIDNGMINIKLGKIESRDAIITTSREEVVKMLKDRDYVTKSFNDGKSTIELVADKTTLFAKGYLNLYTELTGKSVTGNVIRIYTS